MVPVLKDLQSDGRDRPVNIRTIKYYIYHGGQWHRSQRELKEGKNEFYLWVDGGIRKGITEVVTLELSLES